MKSRNESAKALVKSKLPVLRVLIADDYYTFRQELKVVLGFETNIQVVGEATSGKQTLELALKLKPDAVVLDLSMGSTNGMHIITQISAELPDTKVLVLSGHSEQQIIDEAIACGASGYVLKSSSLREVAVLLRQICQPKAAEPVSRSPFAAETRA
jgi:DNA-binding NarL/FixJ family response regulator